MTTDFGNDLLRRRIQDAVGRRFYRKKYNAQTCRDETDPSTSLRAGLDALLAELTRVVQETLQPEHVSVWLLKPQDAKASDAYS